MSAVSYRIANFLEGGLILDLPIIDNSGKWADPLGAPESLSCDVDLRDEDVMALDIFSTTTPKKTVLFAETEGEQGGRIIAWGVISGRSFDDESGVMTLDATGGIYWLKECLIGPATALTVSPILSNGKPNPALDTVFIEATGISLGTIGKRLVAQLLSWPSRNLPIVLPPDVPGTAARRYTFIDGKRVGEALTELSGVEGGPDFKLTARRRDTNPLFLEYPFEHGTPAKPYLGRDVGTWPVGGPESPVTGLMVDEDGEGMATTAWSFSGRSDSKLLVSRLTSAAALAAGFPGRDVVDTSHPDVVVPATLDAYTAENLADAARPYLELSFTLRGNASPGLGEFRSGDWAALDIPSDHRLAPITGAGPLPIRITGISGDESGETITVACTTVDR